VAEWNFMMDSFYVCKGQSALHQIKNQSTTTFSYHLFSKDYSKQQCQCSDTVGWATGRTSGCKKLGVGGDDLNVESYNSGCHHYFHHPQLQQHPE